ncbi:MAG: PEP-CTERM system TPR-repeat protein PrsT [Burkholderiales bacterium]|nr:PEP-CTERM system TPR-repeat protein PrsT [Burkholderiales bacterium]
MFRFNRLIPMTLCLIAACSLIACSKEGDSQKLVTSAKQAQDKGDLKAAVIELKNALQKNPENVEARALLGKLYIKQGDPGSAEKELRKAIQLGKDKSQLLPELGQALLQQGQFQKVIDEIQAPAGAPPLLRARILVQRGNAYLSLGQQDKAKASMEEARTLAPDLAEVYSGLAVLAMVEQKDDETTALIDTAIAKDPQRTTSWLMKGDWLQAKGKPEEAVGAYQSALKADSRSVQAHSKLASVYLSQGKFDAARQEAAAIKKLDPQHLEGKFLSARIDFQQKNYTAARDTLQEILKAVPNHVPSMTLFAATAIELGSFNQAEQYLLPVLQRFPGNALARSLLATAQMKTGQHEKALETLKPLLTEPQPDPIVLAMAGEIYLKLKQFSKSTEFFERAAKGSPQNAGVRTSLALSRLAAGHTEEALSDLKVASGLESDKGRADIMLIMAHVNNKAWDQALKAIDVLETKQPAIPLSHNLRGAVYLNKGDSARARASFEKALSMDPVYFPAAMNLAQLDMKDNKPDAARKRFESVLSKDKSNLQAMLAIAAMEADAKNEKAYLEWINKAAIAHPAALQPRRLLAQHYLRKNDPQKALTVAREAANANPTQPEALDLLGITQMAAGEKDNAIVSFTKLATLSPTSPLPQMRLGAAQEVVKNSEAARTAYQKALAIKPDSVDAQVALARLEFQAGRKSEAIKLIQQVQKQHPTLPAGYLLEGDLLNADKQYDKAVEKYEQAYRLGKSGELVVRIHAALTQAGKARDGEAKLLQWLKENPQDISARNYLADAYLQQKQYKSAAEQYQVMLTQTPQSLIVLNNLAWVYQQMQDKRALAIAERAHNLAPDNPAVTDTLGWILLEQGQVARALPLLQKAFAKQPDNLTLHYHYVVALARSNDRVRAQSELERLLGRGMLFPEEREAQSLLKQLKAGAR